MRYCPNCGKENNDTSPVCVNCGRQLGAPGAPVSFVPADPKRPTLGKAFSAAYTGILLVLISTAVSGLLTNILYPLMYPEAYLGITINTSSSGLLVLYSLFSVISGGVSFAGIIVVLIACSKAQKAEALNPFIETGKLIKVYNFILIGIALIAASTLITDVLTVIFRNSTSSVMYIFVNKGFDDKAYIVKSIIGTISRLADYAGIALCFIGCLNGRKITAEIK